LPNSFDATELSNSVLSLNLIQPDFIDFLHLQYNLCLQLTLLLDEATIVLFVGKLSAEPSVCEPMLLGFK
jgi:hypothetical protein